MRFKQYLNEQNIIMDKKFIKSIENYVDKNNIKDLKFVIDNKNKIPKNFKNKDIYYRGMIVDDKTFNKMINNKFEFNKPTS